MHAAGCWPFVRVVLGPVALVVLASACGGDDDTASPAASTVSITQPSTIDGDPSASSTSDEPTPDPTDPDSADSTSAPQIDVEVAPLPPLPAPTEAQPCDGTTVLCVDSVAATDGDGTAGRPFTTITAALTAAGSGATVQVAAGTYAEPVAFAGASDMTLIGGFTAGGDFSARDAATNETVLQGTDDTSVVSITGSQGIRIEGFRLTGGGGSTDSYNWYGGGVHVDYESSDVSIVGNRIDSNAVDRGDDPGATVGGGIATFGSNVSIIGNVIENNRAGRGSGISAQGASTIIQGNVVNHNVSVGDHGGGIYVFGDVRVLDNHIEGNTVGEQLGYGWGGGIIVYGDETSATLQGNVITDNLAAAAGSGVFIDEGADATLIDELYYANRCPLDGGTEMLVDSGGQTTTVADLVNVTMAETDCPDAGNGAALLVEISVADHPPCEVTVTKSIFWGNQGDDVKSLGCNLTITDSVLEQAFDGQGIINANPMFVDAANGDFSLDPASPALGLGAHGAAA
jgi:hypothetical protein